MPRQTNWSKQIGKEMAKSKQKETKPVDPFYHPEYRRLREGEYIQVGDLFQPDHKNPECSYVEIDEDTTTTAGKLAGLLYLRCYPLVFRKKIKGE